MKDCFWNSERAVASFRTFNPTAYHQHARLNGKEPANAVFAKIPGGRDLGDGPMALGEATFLKLRFGHGGPHSRRGRYPNLRDIRSALIDRIKRNLRILGGSNFIAQGLVADCINTHV